MYNAISSITITLNKKLVAFDMDGMLINGRLVFALGDKHDFIELENAHVLI